MCLQYRQGGGGGGGAPQYLTEPSWHDFEECC